MYIYGRIYTYICINVPIINCGRKNSICSLVSMMKTIKYYVHIL